MIPLDWALAATGTVAAVTTLALVYTQHRQGARIRELEARLSERSTKLHAFAVEVIRAEEEQRGRIARELHDGLGQMMTAVNIELQVLREAAPPEVHARVDDVRALSAQVMAEMRRIAQDLRPAILDEMGLGEAVRALVGRMSRHGQLRIELALSGALEVLPADSAIACYRLVQEALNNVLRHSGASAAKVSLERTGDHLDVEIVDDGKGIDPEAADAAGGGSGLMGLEERIRAIGGSFSFGPVETGGTRLSARLPA
jgi:signal transduction histidine kinase